MRPNTIDIRRWSTPHPTTYLTGIVCSASKIPRLFENWECDSPVSNIGTSNATTEDKKTTKRDKKRTNGVLCDHPKGAAIVVVGKSVIDPCFFCRPSF